MLTKLSIKDLERLSGIKAHTIRIWEQRYGILKPQRTTTNIRWYSQDELKALLNVTLLYHNGVKISKIAQLSAVQLTKQVIAVTKQQFSETDQINNLIVSMIEMDELRFEALISISIEELGFIRTIDKILYPFLVKIGIMWLTDAVCPAQEHFISNLIRQKMIVGIDGLPKPLPSNNRKIVCFLPEGELHELSLLFSTYILREKGYRCIYIGQSVPFTDLKEVIEIIKPEYLVSIFTTPFKGYTVETFLQKLTAQFPKIKILASGYQLFSVKINLPSNVIAFKEPTALIKLVDGL